jgi:hypothetical protein
MASFIAQLHIQIHTHAYANVHKYLTYFTSKLSINSDGKTASGKHTYSNGYYLIRLKSLNSITTSMVIKTHTHTHIYKYYPTRPNIYIAHAYIKQAYM